MWKQCIEILKNRFKHNTLKLQTKSEQARVSPESQAQRSPLYRLIHWANSKYENEIATRTKLHQSDGPDHLIELQYTEEQNRPYQERQWAQERVSGLFSMVRPVRKYI